MGRRQHSRHYDEPLLAPADASAYLAGMVDLPHLYGFDPAVVAGTLAIRRAPKVVIRKAYPALLDGV